jgi:hypothetical protein
VTDRAFIKYGLAEGGVAVGARYGRKADNRQGGGNDGGFHVVWFPC